MNTRTERHTTPQGFVETGIITHEGREYASGGASVSDTHLVCYPGALFPEGWGDRTGLTRTLFRGPIKTWSGETIGTYWQTGHAPGFNGVKLTCYRVRLDDGREYVGRGLGPGMILECRRATTKGR